MPRIPRAALALAVLAAVAAGCAVDHQATGDGGSLEFNIGGIPFRVTSGGARIEGSALGLYLTDQPDACLAITQRPVGQSTILSLLAAPGADGSRSATVIAGVIAPAAGQAVGALTTQLGGVRTGGHDASDGAVSWTPNPNGTYTIDSLDLGFAGTSDRLQLGGLTVPACQ